MKNELEELIRRLNRIAKANNDGFRYNIKVHALRGPGIVLEFTANEAADGHVFVSGLSDTQEVVDGVATPNDTNAITEMVQDVIEGIPSACEAWGYKNVD